jgi:Arc/MetJ family transcription regulator
MRTNIDIDDELMAAAMKASGQTTKKAVVEQALRELVRAQAFRELLDMRVPDWDDGLGTIERLENQRRLHAAEDGSAFDDQK